MDLPTAIGEFAEMLAVGSGALVRLVERETIGSPSEHVSALLGETHDIALRLSAIADALRRDEHSAGAN